MFPSREDAVSGAVAALASGPLPLILAVDGRSGAGKTTLAREIEARVAACCPHISVTSIEVETFIAGWSGLEAGVARLASEIAAPFHHCGHAEARAWDWHRGVWGEMTGVGPADVLLIVGCGSSSGALAPFVDISVWIEAPEALRRTRVTLREGDPSAWWGLWAAQEERLLEQRDSREFADYLVDESAESS